MSRAVHTGGAYGFPLMKFTLTYDGDLPSNGDYKVKWKIRKQFHPQLDELWRTHPSLVRAERRRHFPINRVARVQILDPHHSLDFDADPVPFSKGETLDLCAPIMVGTEKRQFWPLVRESFALRCALRIIFLRREEPGRVIRDGGDLDNRLKTLFDALAVPDNQQIVDDPSLSDPIHCLLENDRLITGVNIETHKLLAGPNASQSEVRLVIEVDVRVAQARAYNQFFLGD